MSKNVLFFILIAALWGGSFVAIKDVVDVLDPWIAVLLRLVIASLGLTAFLAIRRTRFVLPMKNMLSIWAIGCVSIALPFALLFWGEQSISAGLAGILNGTVPIWTSVLMFFILDAQDEKHLSFRKLFGLVLGFGGLVVIFQPLLLAGKSSSIWGGAAVLAMALCYAIGNVLNRRYMRLYPELPVRTAIYHQHLASTAVLAFTAVLFGDWSHSGVLFEKPVLWVNLSYLGLLSTAFALLVYLHLIKTWGSLRSSAVAYLIPVFAIIFEFLFLGEKPQPSALVGAAFILLGIFCLREAGSKTPPQRSFRRRVLNAKPRFLEETKIQTPRAKKGMLNT